MTWEIWELSSLGGDRRILVASYSNRGHALAKLRGLERQHENRWYALRRG